MKTQIKHPVQLEILKNLLYTPEAGFAELNSTELSNDHFTFHIKRLLKEGLILKNREQKYTLSKKGLEIAGRIDLEKLNIIRQPKVGISLCILKRIPLKKDSFENNKILVGKRLHNPLKGKISLYTEKVRLGERLIKTAQRCLKRETKLIAQKYELAGTTRFLKKTDDNITVIDVVLHYFIVSELIGSLSKKTKVSENKWYTVKKLYNNKETPTKFNKQLNLLKNFILNQQQFTTEEIIK